MRLTRQQSDFEKSFKEVVCSPNVASAICEAIINSITNKLGEKFYYYKNNKSALEAEI